ncbi:unnamed protein product [marine sediment metagenome]|uniref:Uncharacterized protein n=1 Tax=marine sediment metagenome TaxID=412755 RepID=X1BZM9_9ZZZZ
MVKPNARLLQVSLIFFLYIALIVENIFYKELVFAVVRNREKEKNKENGIIL